MSDVHPGEKFLDLELRAEVWLAAEEIALEKLLELQPGGTLALARDPDGPVDLVVNGSVVASGELVVVDGKFGFRVTSSSQDELDGLHPEKAAQTSSDEGAPAEEQAAQESAAGEAAEADAAEPAAETDAPTEEKKEDES